MANQGLHIIQKTVITSNTAAVTLTGINDTYDVYHVRIVDAQSTTTEPLRARITKGGVVVDSDNNYDFAWWERLTNRASPGFNSFDNPYGTANADSWRIQHTSSTNQAGTTVGLNMEMDLFNFRNPDANTQAAWRCIFNDESWDGISSTKGAGGFTPASQSVSDGISFFNDTGEFTRGTFILYGYSNTI